MLLYFGILQLLLISSTECLSVNLNCKENQTNIKITIPITSQGVGNIQISEISSEDVVCGEQDVSNTIPADDEPEMEVVVIEEEDFNESLVAVVEEATFEGPVQASGSVNIFGNFGPPTPGPPLYCPMYRPVPLYPACPPILTGPDSLTSDQPEDPWTNNCGIIPYPFYRPFPLYPLPLSETNDPTSSEESEEPEDTSINYDVPTSYPAYRPPSNYPIPPLTTNYSNDTADGPAPNSPLTIDDDTRQFLRNLMLLNVARQSNVPCEVVPILPTCIAYRDASNPAGCGGDGYDGAPSAAPCSCWTCYNSWK